MDTSSGTTKQDILSEIDSWVLRETELHCAFESFPRDSLEKILNETIKKIKRFLRRLLVILVFNLIHIIQIFQPKEKKANFLIFRAKK